MKWFEKNRLWIIPFSTLLIGIILGPGMIWEWTKVKQTKKTHQLEASKHAGEIRAKQLDILLRLLELSKEYREEGRTSLGKIEIDLQIKWQQEAFYNLEYKLAILERRSPRDMYLPFLDFEPPSRPGRVSVHVME